MKDNGLRTDSTTKRTSRGNSRSLAYALGCLCVALVCGCGKATKSDFVKPDETSHSTASATREKEPNVNLPSFNMPPEHQAMRKLVANAFQYIDPENGLIDPESGYPREGWNDDPERGLFLRSFTQITAIGQWIELLANIAAGQADNSFISREDALKQLKQVVTTLRKDQQNSTLSSKGLLVNFLGIDGDKRVGPLTHSVERQDFLENFGEEQGEKIWDALVEIEWLKPQNNDTEGLVQRSATFGSKHFKGPLKPFADETTIARIMDLLDRRVVMVAYGDNANLTTSVAKSIGALLNPSTKSNPAGAEIRAEMEAFLEAQSEGYRGLIDQDAGMFSFGRDETTGKFFGWNNPNGQWVVGHQDYLVNEFRDPSMFLVTRFNLPRDLLGNLGFKVKSYETKDGRTLFTLAPYAGSAFQIFGLDLAMPHLNHPSWRMILENAVDIELDYANRNKMPGFLSESYSGDGTEYTGEVGMPALAVTRQKRITTAPSLYTLGTAYQIRPDRINAFVESNFSVISTLFTKHGPWEGYQTQRKQPIKFQTTAHTLSLILGALGNGPDNLRRYVDDKGLGEKLDALYHNGPAFDLLDSSVEITPWASDGASISAEKDGDALLIRSASSAVAGIVFTLPEEQSTSFSGGVLDIRYQSDQPLKNVVIAPKRIEPLAPGVIPIEILTRFNATDDAEGQLRIPLPTTPALEGTATIELNFQANAKTDGATIRFNQLSFSPLETAQETKANKE